MATSTTAATYRVIAHHLSGRHQRVEGTFELFVAVKATAEVIELTIRRLSTIKHIFLSMPVFDRRYLLFVRLIAVLSALGFPPAAVNPNPTSDGLTPPVTGPQGPPGRPVHKVHPVLPAAARSTLLQPAPARARVQPREPR